MASFGRTARQDVIWGLLNAIRGTVDAGLLGPDDGDYDGDDLVALEATWVALIAEYAAIHTANDTFG